MILEDICDVYSGYAIKQFNEDKIGVPVIKIGIILMDGTIELEDCQYTTEKVNQKYYSEYQDIYIALSGATTGKIGILKRQEKFIVNQRVGIVRKKDNNIPIEFIKYFLFHHTDRIFKEAAGCAQPNISPKQIGKYKVPIIDDSRMKYVVEILDSLTRIINKRKRQLNYLDELIKARFVEMFGDLKNTIRLGDCCKVHARIGWQALTRDEHMKTGEYMLVTGTDFIDGKINYNTCVYVTRERYEMDPHIILRENDILITKDGSIGKVAIIHNLSKPATLNSGVFVVRPKDIFNKEYISGVFRGPLFEKFIELSKTGATIKHLNQKHLVEFRIPLPTLEKQEVFARFSNQINKSKVEVQKALDKAQLLFDSLIQKYFG